MTAMPAKPWPIWAVAWLVLLGFPFVNIIYWPEATRYGIAAADSDAVALWTIGSLFLAPLIMMPVMFFATYIAVKRYHPGSLLVWRSDRPLRSLLLTLLFGLPAAAVAWALVDGFALDQPWYEWLWVPLDLLAILWMLWVRAAAINQRPDEESRTEIFS